MASHNVIRGESHPPYSRKRSSTVSSASMFKNVPHQPLQVGDTTILSTWVSDTSAVPVVLNHDYWPGVAEGDMIEVMTLAQGDRPGFLFIVPNDTGQAKQTQQQQITIKKTIADTFGFVNHKEVILAKVDKANHSADYIEVTFQDQYLGRNDMWRITRTLKDQCVYSGQEIDFLGSVAGTIGNIFTQGAKVASAQVVSATKVVYRSLSAKVTIFIQVCREIWDFAGDGERYYEKIVHSFLPTLFSRWSDVGAKHIVTIILVSRVYYDQTEVEYAAGPLRQDDDGRWYKDFYKVITDLETIQDWRPTLVSLKDSFFAFQRDILLTHHYYRAFRKAENITPSPNSDTSAEVRLVGTLSYAHDGPILEAINLILNPTETHYIDRSLSLTGTSMILVTPGTGYFVASKRLLRTTTLRILDQGFGLDLVTLAKKPLHRTPIFSFKGEIPELRSHNPEKEGRFGSGGSRELDPLWGGGDGESLLRNQFWWEPFWISTTFWDQQMDLPFRFDRFVARARMQEIQMLGLLEHDLLSTIEIPYLDASREDVVTSSNAVSDGRNARRLEADNFDINTFALKKNDGLTTVTRNSVGASSSSASTIVPPMMTSSGSGRERIPISLSSSTSSKFPPIAEDQGQETPMSLSPRVHPNIIPAALPVALPREPNATPVLSSSPSQASVHSSRSVATVASSNSKKTGGTQSQGSLASKFAPGWLFNPFRTSSQPQTSMVSVTSTMTSTSQLSEFSTPNTSTSPLPVPRPPKPVSIQNKRSHGRNIDDGGIVGPNRSSFSRTSPLSSSPRDRDGSDAVIPVRRSTMSTLSLPPVASSPPRPPTNPSRPTSSISYEQVSLARRWQHVFPAPLFEHQIKWKSVLTPACLPLTVEHFPTQQELDTAFEYFSYDFVVDPPSMSSSFCIKVPGDWKNRPSQAAKDMFALAVMKGQTALRLAQGFQFILRPRGSTNPRFQEDRNLSRRSRSFIADEEIAPKPIGATDVLQTPFLPVYMSMTNEIHRLSYNGEVIKVELYVRRVGSPTKRFDYDYDCLVWPKRGDGYTEVSTSFKFPGVEKLGWNSMDMVVAGYEQHFNHSSRFWRTRFIVLPSEEPPLPMTGSSGERLNDEEIRLAGMYKLAEFFGKARWMPPGEKAEVFQAPHFLPTYLGPAASVCDDNVVTQLEEIHASGPLKKKKNSDKVLQEYSLASIAKAMRDEDGVSIKDHRWHGAVHHDSFTGADLTSWLVREFSDISTREQAVEAGSKLHAQGLFEHCRKHHGFLDGHYFYRFKSEFGVPSTPRGSIWNFRGRHGQVEEKILDRYGTSGSPIAIKGTTIPPRKYKKRLVLSQTFVIDADVNKKSPRAETAILHHDIIHNPATAFHFELNWISTSARSLEELIRQWSRSIERHGLRLVEGFVDQIMDIRDKNAFQSCFPIRLAITPPTVKRSPENQNAASKCYFECMLLKRFGFVVDVEAQDSYSDQVEVFYSYRRSSYKYTQFVHRSGAAFVQVIGGQEGFIFLTNRLLAPGRLGNTRNRTTSSQVADDIRDAMYAFCSDPAALTTFYNKTMASDFEDDVEPLAI